MFARIVVPLDGSDLALQALPRAREMSRLYDAPLFFVQVVDAHRSASLGPVAPGGITLTAVAMAAPESEPNRQYVDGMVLQLQSEGYKASGVVLTGRAGAGIVSVLNEHDLLVMSSHGKTGMRRWLLGSVAEDVIRKAPGSVLLVRLSDEER